MAREAKGELRKLAEGWEARVTLRGRDRLGLALPFSHAQEVEAGERCRLLAEIARRLRKAGAVADAPALLKMAAIATAGPKLQGVLKVVDVICTSCTQRAARYRGRGVRRPLAWGKIRSHWRKESAMARERKGTLVWRTSGWCALVTVDVDGESVRKRCPLGTTSRLAAKRKLARLVVKLAREGAPSLEEVASEEPTIRCSITRSDQKDGRRRRANGTGSVCEFTDEQGRRRFKIGITQPSGKQRWKRMLPECAKDEAIHELAVVMGMAMANKGTVECRNGRWYAKLSLGGGRRKKFALPKGISEAKARDMAQALARQIASGDVVAPPLNRGPQTDASADGEAVDESGGEFMVALVGTQATWGGVVPLDRIASKLRVAGYDDDRIGAMLMASVVSGMVRAYVEEPGSEKDAVSDDAPSNARIGSALKETRIKVKAMLEAGRQAATK